MNLIIEAIEEKLQRQKNELLYKDLELKDLKAQLEAAHADLADAKIKLSECVKHD